MHGCCFLSQQIAAICREVKRRPCMKHSLCVSSAQEQASTLLIVASAGAKVLLLWEETKTAQVKNSCVKLVLCTDRYLLALLLPTHDCGLMHGRRFVWQQIAAICREVERQTMHETQPLCVLSTGASRHPASLWHRQVQRFCCYGRKRKQHR